jgi:5'-phosphate synthase pdxT subunit
LKVGVLALQGNYEMHSRVLQNINIDPVYIRYTEELDSVNGLIIPGGESTTMSYLMERNGFYEKIRKFATNFPVLGTCAGLILMSNKIVDSNLSPLGLLDINTDRNGYGRQINSGTVEVEFKLNNTNYSIPGSFIRAPKIIEYKNIEIIAKFEEVPVIVSNGKHMAISFHPELDNISILHEYVFLNGNK